MAHGQQLQNGKNKSEKENNKGKLKKAAEKVQSEKSLTVSLALVDDALHGFAAGRIPSTHATLVPDQPGARPMVTARSLNHHLLNK